MKKIYIPHLFYTVYICDKSKATGRVKKYLKDENMNACREISGSHASRIWIKMPIKPVEVPTLAHEIVHVLQHIAKERDIDFKDEEEHFAYLMQYILNEALNYEFM